MREKLAIRAAIIAAIMAGVNLAVLFGWTISVEQLAGIDAALTAVSMAVLVVWTRGQVTPADDPRDDAGRLLVPAEYDTDEDDLPEQIDGPIQLVEGEL